MIYSFPRYLLSKQSVDDRALNRHVFETLSGSLPAQPIRAIEVGAGLGTMFMRLVRWGLLSKAEYIAVDEMAENIEYGLQALPRWAAENRLDCDHTGQNELKIWDESREFQLTLRQGDIFDFSRQTSAKSDLLIAHAVLDLFPLPASLPLLFSLLKPGGLAWLTINFDGATIFEPTLDSELDAQIEWLYHHSMDTRLSGGDSQTGRHLFGHLQACGAHILAAGASDWVVYGENGTYPQDEAYFLAFILHFFEESLSEAKELDQNAFRWWLKRRREQLEHGELVYIAHQMDFLAQV